MSDIMRPIPFDELIVRIFTEYRNHGSIFGIKKENFYKPSSNRIEVFGQKCSTPIGPAAGPHTQLAQNIVSSYLVGGRFIELKTVQIMDYLGTNKMISKPCIDARDEGFNVEWSTEYTLEKAYDEYLKAWIIIHLIQALLTGKNDSPDFVFNMSVGYNLEGIKQPKMQTFIDSMINANNSPLFKEYTDQLNAFIQEGEFYSGSDFEKNEKVLSNLVGRISPKICTGVTISTMHGCPPEEIEAICSYMLKEKHLNTFVKLNPTLLGYQKVRDILDKTGFDYVELKHESFDHDLQLKDAFAMLHRLVTLSKSLKLGFGVKLTNTLANVNNEKIFEGDERYMSGRILLPISTSVAALISKEFEGNLPISYSGGANINSVGLLFESGIKPITLATDMLKPGGYTRMKSMACLLESSKGWNVNKVDVSKVQELADKSVNFDFVSKDFRGTNAAKANDQLPLFNCFVSPCQEACPIHQCIPDYISLVSEGRYAEALSLIYKDNALPNITCNICDHKCQLHCSRMDYEGSVEIRKIKKIAVEQGSDSFIKNYVNNKNTVDTKVAIIGAGPAGLSAAYFLAKAGFKNVTIFEKEQNAGGVVANIIPKFRIEPDAILSDIKFIESLGVNFKFGSSNDEVKIDALKKTGYEYILYAVGAEAQNKLEIEGDQSNIVLGLDFLKEFKNNNAKLGSNVIVVGAGNSAMDCARAAIRTPGVKSVSVVYRRSKKEMPASYEEYEEAIADGVKFNFLTNPKSIGKGKLICSKMILGNLDESGRRKPIDSGEEVSIDCDSLVLALGEHVDSDIVSSFGIPLNEKGWPIVSESNETDISGVFAIGDMATGPSTVVGCIGSARKAVDKILFDLNITSEESDDYGEDEVSDEEYFEEEDRFFDRISQKKAKLYPNREKIVSDFVKFAKQEEHRCMNCSYLCSKCVDVCPNRANVAVDMRCSENSIDAFQILHIDAYCNECGNCAAFCSHQGRPYKDKFTLFSRLDDFENSTNQGFYVEGSEIKVRINNQIVECRINGNGEVSGKIPSLVKDLIEEVFISYGYLLGRVDE